MSDEPAPDDNSVIARLLRLEKWRDEVSDRLARLEDPPKLLTGPERLDAAA